MLLYSIEYIMSLDFGFGFWVGLFELGGRATILDVLKGVTS